MCGGITICRLEFVSLSLSDNTKVVISMLRPPIYFNGGHNSHCPYSYTFQQIPIAHSPGSVSIFTSGDDVPPSNDRHRRRSSGCANLAAL